MTLNPATITPLVFSRLKSDAEGNAFRSQLATFGSGAGSIIKAKDLRSDDYPAVPLAALRRRPAPKVDGPDGVVTALIYEWWFYDERQQDFSRVESLIPLAVDAFAARELEQATGGVIGNVDMEDLGGEIEDDELGLIGTYLRIILYAG